MILLDTHVLIWLALHPEKISQSASDTIQEARTKQGGLAISAVTLYEIAFLASRNRVVFQSPVESFLDEVERLFVIRPINSRICAETMRLPEFYPKDPMDRIIGATAIAERIDLVTADVAIQQSKAVRTIW